MKVLVAMSGGVDSSVAAALLLDGGHDVVGVTLKLWGGAQDSGCCSVGDVEDARRVAQQLGIAHHVFNFTDEFDERVVAPYVQSHVVGRTPNPCVECNRHLKFDRLLARADQLGFDAVATGHHARIASRPDGLRLLRGVDPSKDQSYVLHMLGPRHLARCLFPVGELTKAEVRAVAASRGLRTAAKAESQDTCFITASGGRGAFLGERIPMRAARLVDTAGREVGGAPAVEMITVGQRRGLGGDGLRRYAIAVDVETATVTVGSKEDLLTDRLDLEDVSWVSGHPSAEGTVVTAQTSAHGAPLPGVWRDGAVHLDPWQTRAAPGQSVVLYDGEWVLGGGVCAVSRA